MLEALAMLSFEMSEQLKLDGNKIYLLYTSSAIIQSMLEVLVMAGRRPKYPLHASLSLQASTFNPSQPSHPSSPFFWCSFTGLDNA